MERCEWWIWLWFWSRRWRCHIIIIIIIIKLQTSSNGRGLGLGWHGLGLGHGLGLEHRLELKDLCFGSHSARQSLLVFLLPRLRRLCVCIHLCLQHLERRLENSQLSPVVIITIIITVAFAIIIITAIVNMGIVNMGIVNMGIVQRLLGIVDRVFPRPDKRRDRRVGRLRTEKRRSHLWPLKRVERRG